MAKHDATIFYAVIESHLSCLDEVLKCGKSDVIEIALELIGILEISKYDDCIRSKAFLKENFTACLSFLRRKPLKRYLRILANLLKGFSPEQQTQLLEIFPLFDEDEHLTHFLIKHYEEFPTVQRRPVLKTLCSMKQSEGINFVVNNIYGLSSEDKVAILNHMTELELSFSKDCGRSLRDLCNAESDIEVKVSCLKLMRCVEDDFSLQLLMDSISKQSEAVITAAIQSLIYKKKYAQIPIGFLQQYSSSVHYDLACSVAQIYALLYQSHGDKETLQEGMSILSYLMNQELKPAKLAAVKAAQHFIEEVRTQDWIGSMLLSETDLEVCTDICSLIEDYKTDSVKEIYLKALTRDQIELKVLALNALAEFEDSDLFNVFSETLIQYIEYEDVAKAAIRAMSRSVPSDGVQFYKELISHENVTVQLAAIDGLMNWSTDELKVSLERVYQNASGMVKVKAACVLFRLGVPYILDDVLQLLESSKNTDKKTGLQCLQAIITYYHSTPYDRIPKQLINVLEIYYREAEARVVREDVLLEFHVAEILRIRHLFLSGQITECENYIESLDETIRKSFYVSTASLWIQQLRKSDIDIDECLRLVSFASDCFLNYEILDKQYKKLRRRTEYLINQLRFLESRQKYYQEILSLLESFSQEEMESTVFSNLLKVLRNNSLPLDHGIHHLFVQIYIKLKAYHKAFKHLTYGFLTMKQANYIVELATSCMKCGYLEKAETICQVGLKLEKSEKAKTKLQALLKKIAELSD